MLKLSGKGSITTCDGITRRDFLQVGALGTIGLTLAKYAQLQALGAVSKGNDEKAAIMIFNLGAPSQLDTWDMKPLAPVDDRPVTVTTRSLPNDAVQTELDAARFLGFSPRQSKHRFIVAPDHGASRPW